MYLVEAVYAELPRHIVLVIPGPKWREFTTADSPIRKNPMIYFGVEVATDDLAATHNLPKPSGSSLSFNNAGTGPCGSDAATVAVQDDGEGGREVQVELDSDTLFFGRTAGFAVTLHPRSDAFGGRP